MELEEITASYDEILLVLKVRGRDVVIAAHYQFSGNNGSVIKYLIRNIGEYLPPKHKQYKFSSRKEKLQIAAYVEEALKVFGLHHSLSPDGPSRLPSVTLRFPLLQGSHDRAASVGSCCGSKSAREFRSELPSYCPFGTLTICK